MPKIMGKHQIAQVVYSAHISSGGTSISGTVDAPASSTMTFTATNTGLYKITAVPWLSTNSGNTTAQIVGTVGSPTVISDSTMLAQPSQFKPGYIEQYVGLVAGVSYTFIIRTTGSGFFGMDGYIVAQQVL